VKQCCAAVQGRDTTVVPASKLAHSLEGLVSSESNVNHKNCTVLFLKN